MDRPPDEIVIAFGGDCDLLVPLEGGEGKAWRAGTIVLKPGSDRRYVEWSAELTAAIGGDERFRVASLRQASTGAWAIGGWAATDWLEGGHLTGHWDRTLAVSEDFHRAIAEAEVSSPEFLRTGTSPWSVGDRLAWCEQPPEDAWPGSVHEMLHRLAPQLEKPWRGSPPQPVHADIGGNILFADGLPPAVIDLSMFLRPAPFAHAVLVADAVAWSGAQLSFAADFLARQTEGHQLLARAMAFRVATAAVLCVDTPARVESEIDAYRSLLPLIDGFGGKRVGEFC